MLKVPPYTHGKAMCQLPVPITLFGRACSISPLTMREIQGLDALLQGMYCELQTGLLPDMSGLEVSVRERLEQDILTKAAGLHYENESGIVFISQHPPALIRCIDTFIRKPEPVFTEEELTFFLCPDNTVPPGSLQLFMDIQQAVMCPLPPSTSKRKPDPPMHFLPHDLEGEGLIRTYRALAQQYHWTYNQISDMTPYQVYMALYLLPEEEQRLLELEAAKYTNPASGGSGSKPDPAPLPVPQGTVQMTPEQYAAFLADRQKQGK